MLRNRLIKRLNYSYIIILCLGVVACSQQETTSQARVKINQLRKQYQPVKTQALFYTPTPKPITYQYQYSRDPFVSKATPQATTEALLKSPLTAYPLNVLKLVGIVVKGKLSWAYVSLPDNKIYLVKVGDKLGNNQGKIIRMTAKKLFILEKDNASTKTNIITLELKDKTG